TSWWALPGIRKAICVRMKRPSRPARRPSAGAVPGRWGVLAVRTPPAALRLSRCRLLGRSRRGVTSGVKDVGGCAAPEALAPLPYLVVGFFGAGRTSVAPWLRAKPPALTLVFTFMGQFLWGDRVSRRRSGQAAHAAACERTQRCGAAFASLRFRRRGLL